MFKFILLLIALCPFSSVQAGRIIYPGKSCPAIIQRGTELEILYYTHNRAYVRSIDSVILRSQFCRIGLPVQNVEYGKFVYDDYTELFATYRITVGIPEGIPEDMFDLIVKIETGTSVMPRSVKIVKEFSRRHKFIHISDPHVSRQVVQTEHGDYARELELLDKFTDVANLIAPDFVIVTGDLVHEVTRLDADSTGYTGYLINNRSDIGPYFDEKLRYYFQGAMGFSGVWGIDAPVFSTPGNHDYYGIASDDSQGKCRQWNKALGKRVYGFSYAGTRVIVTDDFMGDTIRDRPITAPMSGLQGDMIRRFFEAEGKGDLIVWGKHHYGRIDSAFMNDNKVGIILHGHSHSPREEWIGTRPTLNTRPGTICRSNNAHIWKQTLGFFRVFTIDGDRFESTKPLRFCSNPTATYDRLKLNLTLNYVHPNDGTQRSNEAIIENKLNAAFEAGRIRFVMPKGRYSVSQGRIDQSFDSGERTVVDVRIDIPRHKTIRVAIFPKS